MGTVTNQPKWANASHETLSSVYVCIYPPEIKALCRKLLMMDGRMDRQTKSLYDYYDNSVILHLQALPLSRTSYMYISNAFTHSRAV